MILTITSVAGILLMTALQLEIERVFVILWCSRYGHVMQSTQNFQLAEDATLQLGRNSGLSVTYRKPDLHTEYRDADGILIVEDNPPLAVEVRRNLRKKHLKLLQEKLQGDRPWLLITDYLSRPMQEYLRDNQVYYLDLAGNTYLKLPGILVSVKGEKVPEASETAKSSELSDAQIKALFGLLVRPEWINHSYLQLEPLLKVGKATLSKLFQVLQEREFIVGSPQSYRWQHRQGLWDFWAEAYGTQLRDKLLVGRFRLSANQTLDSWESWQLDPITWWSGEPAVGLITRDLVPGELTLYSQHHVAFPYAATVE